MTTHTETDRSLPEGETMAVSGSGAGPALAPGDFMNRTFLGGMSLSARISLFVLIGLGCLAIGGFGLFRAGQDLGAARKQVASAVELAGLVDTVEAAVWRLRAEGLLAKQKQSATAAKAHIAKAMELGRLLDDIYSRFNTATLGEHITTIREALAQYAEAYGAAASGGERKKPTGSADLAKAVRNAARGLQERLTRVNILSLSKTFADMRESEAAFMKNGRTENLIAMTNNRNAFRRLLEMVPLGKPDIADIRKSMAIYQQRFTEYAKGRIATPNVAGRLDEIFSYMIPSIESLKAYAEQRQRAGVLKETKMRDVYLPLIAAVGAGLMLVVLLAGALILRSVTAPVAATALAGRRIAGGEDDVVVWGLGNEDETGDLARALSVLKQRLGEIASIRKSLEKARSEAERGRAATEQAEWLRHDLETMKTEVGKGQAAIDEVELLHKVIEAMKTQSAERAREELERQTETLPLDPQTETASMDTISEISQRVAKSSLSVTAAAEDAERTGTLIRNLNEASKRIGGIEALVKTIGDQADLLWVGATDGDPEEISPGGNLVMLNADQRDNNEPASGPRLERSEMESSIGRRFDVIRATASQTTWALRDINDVILAARDLALTIAQTTSAEALHVTTDLLEQSENLRYMLDSLVQKMRDQLFGGDTEEIEKPVPVDRDNHTKDH